MRGTPLNIVAELEFSWVTSSRDGPMRGYTCVVAKRHVVEIFELTEGEAAAWARDLKRVAEAVFELVDPVKLNYEIHGNSLPHLHTHVFPRFVGDPFEGGPIDPKRVTTSPYSAGEFERFRRELGERLR